MRRLTLLALAVCVPRLAAASIVVPMTEPELVAKSDLIVVGTVVRTRIVRAPSGAVMTRAEVQVSRGLRGAKQGEVVAVEVPGGALGDGTEVVVEGAPRLRPGDTFVGFLERHGNAGRPLGLSFGLLEVRQIGPGDQRVFRHLDGLVLMPKAGTSLKPDLYVVAGEPLETFLARIADHVRRQAAAAPQVKP